MRRILVISDRVPFTETPTDKIADALVQALRSAETDVECIALPASRYAGASLEDMLARRALDVWNVDRMIALCFPACLLAHSQKIVWFADGERDLPAPSPALELSIKEAKRVYAASAAARKRLSVATRCSSRVLAVPAEGSWARVAAELLR